MVNNNNNNKVGVGGVGGGAIPFGATTGATATALPLVLPLLLFLLLAIVTTTVITLLILIGKTLSSIEIDNEGRWGWDGREAEEYGPIVFTCIVLILGLLGVVRVGYKPILFLFLPTTTTKTTNNDFQIGQLGGSLFCFTNMAILSFFTFVNMEQRENDNNGNNNNGNNGQRWLDEYNNNNYQQQQEREEMEEGYMEKVMTITSLIIALVYGLVTVGLFILIQKNSLFITTTTNNDDDTTRRRFDNINSIQSSAHSDVLMDGWKFLSLFSIVGVSVSFVCGIISVLFTEDGERMREEGNVYNFLLTCFWTLLLVIAMKIIGNKIFGRTKDTTEVQVGFFCGCLMFFAITSLLLAGLYGGWNPFDDRGGGGRRQLDGVMGSLLFGYSCFTISMSYFVFGYLVFKYSVSIIHVNIDEVQSSTGEYVAMVL